VHLLDSHRVIAVVSAKHDTFTSEEDLEPDAGDRVEGVEKIERGTSQAHFLPTDFDGTELVRGFQECGVNARQGGVLANERLINCQVV
jgi:hypothetical protein